MVPPRNPNLFSQSIRSTFSVLVYTIILQLQGTVRKNSVIAPPKTETALFLGVLPEIFFYTQNCSVSIRTFPMSQIFNSFFTENIR